jgi:hypothetical protein
MGDAVNVAARLKDVGLPGNVHVGPETYEAARARFLFEAGEPLALRGKTERVAAHRALAPRRGIRRATGGRGALVDTPVIGRPRERAALADALAAITAGRPGRTIVLRGEEGAGKSRLVGDLVAAAAEAGATVVTGGAAQGDRERPMVVAADLLAGWAGIGVADDATDVRTKLATAADGVTGIDAVALGDALTNETAAARDATIGDALARGLGARPRRGRSSSRARTSSGPTPRRWR